MPDLRAHQARLELWSAGQMLQQLDLENSRYRLGRDPACELPLSDPGLSRVHAILEKVRPSDRDFALEDFNSSNGLFHRDRRIRWIHLRDGDAVQLGSPLKGEAPELRYSHPRSPLEQALHLLGVTALAGSALVVSGMLLAASVGGGSKIRSISGPVKIFSADGQQVDAKEGSSTALPSLQAYPLHLRQALLASEEASLWLEQWDRSVRDPALSPSGQWRWQWSHPAGGPHGLPRGGQGPEPHPEVAGVVGGPATGGGIQQERDPQALPRSGPSGSGDRWL